MLNSLFNNIESSVDLLSILICTVVSVILGFVIAFVHKKTAKSSQNFLVSLVILPVLVEVIMIMVNGNLGTSVAIAGAFSLIRFRSVPGTSKEIISVFFAMAIGVITGMGHAYFAIMITILVSFVILFIYQVKLFNLNPKEKLLKITIPENLDYTTMFNETFKKFAKSATLEQVKTTNMGSLFELSYRIVLNDNANEKEFIDEIRIKNGNLKVLLSHTLDGTDM